MYNGSRFSIIFPPKAVLKVIPSSRLVPNFTENILSLVRENNFIVSTPQYCHYICNAAVLHYQKYSYNHINRRPIEDSHIPFPPHYLPKPFRKYSSQWRHAVAQLVKTTLLQAGRSRVRFPMVSLEVFIDIILPTELWQCGSPLPLTEMSTRDTSWGIGGRRVGMTTLPPSSIECPEMLEPQAPGTIRPIEGLLYPFLFPVNISSDHG